jgi:cytoskeletal protein RodZ
MTLAPLLLLAVVVVAACTGSGGATDDATGASHAATAATVSSSTVTSNTVTSRTVTSTSATSATGASTTAGSSRPERLDRRTSTVRTDGGEITVEARDGTLAIVGLTTEPGWHSDRRSLDPTHLLVTFDRDGAHVEVRLELTADGIRSETHATTRG